MSTHNICLQGEIRKNIYLIPSYFELCIIVIFQWKKRAVKGDHYHERQSAQQGHLLVIISWQKTKRRGQKS